MPLGRLPFLHEPVCRALEINQECVEGTGLEFEPAGMESCASGDRLPRTRAFALGAPSGWNSVSNHRFSLTPSTNVMPHRVRASPTAKIRFGFDRIVARCGPRSRLHRCRRRI